MKQLLSFCLFSLLAFPIFSQSRLSFGVKADAGLAGIEKENFQTLESSTLTTSYTPGLSASIGLVGAYYFGQQKRLGVSVGLLSNFSTYTLHKSHKFPAVSSSSQLHIEHNTASTFKLVNFLTPVKLNYRYKKATFSLGLLNTWHLFTEFTHHSRFRDINPTSEWEHEFTFMTDTREGRGLSMGIAQTKVTFKHRYTPQMLFGAAYEIGHAWSIGLEYAGYLRANELTQGIITADPDDYVTLVEFQHNTLTMNLTWWFDQQ